MKPTGRDDPTLPAIRYSRRQWLTRTGLSVAGLAASAWLAGCTVPGEAEAPDLVPPAPPLPAAPTVRYQDLAAPGDTIREVLPKVPKGHLLLLGAGTFEFKGFAQENNNIGLLVPSTIAGIAGVGRKTVLRMSALSSTSAAKVPRASQTTMTNQLYVMKAVNGTNQVFRDFTLEGTEQGHLYNGFLIMDCTAPRLQDVLVTGIPGDDHSPPGETFGVNLYLGSGFLGERVEVDGRRADGKSYGASPFGYNSYTRGTLRDCYFHHNFASTFTHWQSTDCVTYNVRSHYNGSGPGNLSAHGINHERSTRITHYSPSIIIDTESGNSGYHMSMNNDEGDGVLTVREPAYDMDPRYPGKFVVVSFTRYRGVPRMVFTRPDVTGANGRSLPTFFWAH